jgi:hypothetical protein
MASNYDDVVGQLISAGLQVTSLDIGRMKRCKVEGGGREKRGWYHLHEIRLPNGDDLIVGSYGVWQGNENNATKVEIRKTELSLEQRESLRKRLAEKRNEIAFLVQMMELAPEMVAVVFHQGFRFAKPAHVVGFGGQGMDPSKPHAIALRALI